MSVQLKNFRGILFASFIIGAIVDLIVLFSAGVFFPQVLLKNLLLPFLAKEIVKNGVSFNGISFGFSYLAFFATFMLVVFFQIIKIKNTFFGATLGALVFFGVMILGIFLWLERGNGTDMSGLLFFMGAIPSFAIGAVFGYLISKKVKFLEEPDNIMH